ncbi:LysR substrate-binding domain-containing protein [Marinomonas sp. THO17]|uniref:LysR substrate-binding domain-containing protein n=1 Tax=Marinomonas sp. THO17 TaxID=3149048 RepID=UPI00336BCA8C
MSLSRSLPPLKSMLAFRFAAESLSFKDAAEHLFVTQAAISQQIKTLEQHLGVTLFERQTRQVILTSEGHYLYDYVNRAFQLMEEGVRGITQDPNPNTLVISAVPSFSSRWLVPRLGMFQASVPDINLRLSPSIGLSSFADTDLDLCVRLGEGHYDGLQSELLFEENLLPVCHPALIDTSKGIVEQLLDISIITDTGPDMEHVWPKLQTFLKLYDLPLKSNLHVADSTSLVEALLSRQGLAMVRFGLVYDHIQKGQLICPLPVYMKSRYDFYLVAPAPHFKYEKIQAFRRWIKSEVKEIDVAWQKYLAQHTDCKALSI